MNTVSNAVNAVSYPRFAGTSTLDDDSADPATKHDPISPILAGKRVLIVEDEFFVAIQIEETLHSFGCETIGPFTTLELGLQASRKEQFDIAVLDINLHGRMVFPLADELTRRGIPFLFLTGYAVKELPESYRALPRLQKPFDGRAVRREMEALLHRGT